MVLMIICEHCGKETSWNPVKGEPGERKKGDEGGKKQESKDDGDASSEPQGENDESRFSISKALMIGGALVAVPCASATLVGFGAAGIVGGSMAAAAQAAVGNVAAGSAFATLQALGMTGVFVNGATVGGAAAGAGAAAAMVTNRSKKEQDWDEMDNTENESDGLNQTVCDTGGDGTLTKCTRCGRTFQLRCIIAG
eukprot:CAMPEP_0119029746 /NCGR_PEP_ID=MMETSP1176-20130426/40675_1 /TAXON_ID=265551 /ORGANISM="Synedropsis recta cf, Strain CCMP1620" /LENGTH=195 /DNA_ID=CAMNT_0006986101 /DNA_START=98 /DNA_END=685 /DNA_ORIENTATION=+